ncbi:single-stranded-DNA-specific exonuclease RecJ [Fictibacillus terranigra]|uniref:Single-stranded-DNA-specific exonuclease RecJ n=1 Tax=Fictibacillus terranigra TaxID=3058424 RepID=A0ABT8E4C5_9BACL|nr:single-stranded-DNA-specific exonuclease RecJ [Fictibacillus sp. CENA-BCM004]MDN4072762.1 single-stranded-DNA-specific exonuclease RecJ [Fictibacillus sp. CENA-BCM004]
MLNARTRWNVQTLDEDKVQELASSLKIPKLVANLLVARGLETKASAQQFLSAGTEAFHDPFLMDGMKEAVDRIQQAIAGQEKILVFGDYDADGVSSTSVMVYTLKALNANFDFYIPNRFTEGYGPNEPALRWAKEQGFSLVITVDTGISAVNEARAAKEIGLDFIVTDHHEPPPVLPDAYSIINPKKPGCPYPFKGLAGVGVAFKVAHALLGNAPLHLLDIACIGTIADLVPLVDENRIIAKEGIKALERTTKTGLKALLEVAGLKDTALNAEHVGFAIGPRVNAAGRLDSAVPAVHLFTTDDKEEAAMLAAEIDQLNKTRQTIVSEITKEAVEMVEQKYPPEENNVLVVAKEGWNAGVIGIVASRLVEKFYRPTIVLSIDEEKGLAKGSARSIEGFDMFENLSLSRDILPHFGGHPMAAGMTLAASDLEELRTRLNRQAGEQLTEEDFKPVTFIDLECSLDEVTIETIEQMNKLAPFGVNNPTPRVLIPYVRIGEIKKIGSQSNHLKIQFSDGQKKLDAIGFHKGPLMDELSYHSPVSAVGELSINEWNGFRKPQLMLSDLAVKEWQLFDLRGIRDVQKKMAGLPKNKVLFIAFNAETKSHPAFSDMIDQIRLYPQEKEDVHFQGKYVVFLDVPKTREEFFYLLESNPEPERTYVIFHQENDQFFSSVPTREQFRWFYAFLTKRKTFDADKHGEELARLKGWSREAVPFMSKVFFELDFVTIEDGVISINDRPDKKDLKHSYTYRSKLEQAEIENQLVYSSYQDLKNCFDQFTGK